jgi:hypothetical protein
MTIQMKAFLMTLATAVGVGFLVFFGKQMMTVFGKELVLFVLLVAVTIYLFYMLYQLFLFNLKTARNK